MLPKKPRRILYALLLTVLSVICTSALANTKVFEFIVEVASILKESSGNASEEIAENANIISLKTNSDNEVNNTGTITATPFMFATIIQGADQEVGCSTNGLTVARFNLCGDSDNRVISLSGSHSSVTWQLLGGSCSPNINDDCPNTTPGCYSTVGSGPTFNLNAASVPSTTGAEYRVVVDGVNYYFKVKKSTITQTFVKNDFICGVPGRIQITNLSSAYEFSINDGSGFGPWQGPIFNNLNTGTYVVKARLRNTANTCEYPYQPITISQLDIAIDATFIDAQCSGDTGSITVTANNVPGPYKYTLLDSNGVAQEFTAFIATNPYTFSAVGFGTYTVQVETQQCTGDPLNGIDPPRQDRDTGGNPIIIGSGLSPLDASTEVNSSFGCSNITSVDITVNTTGGAAPYRFSVNGGPLQPSYTGTTTYTVSSAGTYDFLITDSNGCTISASSNVENLLPPDVTVNGIDGTCSNGGAKINFTINDARGYNLSYRVNTGDPWTTNPQISVPAGTYPNIEVRYQQGGFQCTLAMPSVTVTNVGAITGSAIKISDRTCNVGGGLSGGQIDFQGPFTGGSGSGYQFSIDGLNFSGTTSYTNLVPGTYTPIIRDSGGCRLTLTPITIQDVNPPTDLTFAQLNISCATNTSDVQLTPTSAAAIVNYSIISPSVINNGGSNTFVGLSTTTSYIFQITDANNCTYTEGFTPALISSIRARVKSGGDLKVCTGALDGSGSFLIDGFASNYTYNINGGIESGAQNNAQVDLTGLGAGTYTITVTDVDSGCTDSAAFTVQEPSTPLSLTGTVTPMTCANNNLGRVVANPVGGWGTNRYTLVYPGGGTTVGPKSGNSFGNLSVAGTYTLSVTDAEGCTATFNFDLTPIASPTIGLDTASSDFCYIPGPGATIAVTSTAGTAPLASHQYRINGGTLQASPIFTGVAPGNYTLEVVDANGCRDDIPVTINPQLRVTISVDTEIPCGPDPGLIRVIVTGGYTSGAGTKQYEISSDNGATFGAPVPLTSNNFLYPTNVSGTYVFRITDNNTTSSGCVAISNPIILDPPISIAPASHEVFPPACGEVSSGRVIITPDATSGVAPYEINFDGAGWSSNTIYSGLNEGQTYTYTVRDARGCETLPQNVTIPSPGTAPDATLAASPATCFGGTVEGTISVTSVIGGTPDFTYILQDQYGVEIERIGPTSSTSEIFSGVPVGNYMVITLDGNGCLDQDNIRVDDGDLDVVPDPVAIPICAPGGFTNTVTIVGGVGPFEIRLVTDPPSVYVPVNLPPDRHTFAGLQYGVTYTVEVRDLGTGCTHIETIDPIDGPNLDVAAASTAGYCDLRNGQITYEITNFNSGDNLFIEIYNVDTGTLIHSQTQNNVTTVPYNGFYDTLPGNYQVIVTNLTDFCTDGALITIDQNLPNIYIVASEPANCNADGQLTVVGGGGAGGPYQFAFGLSGFTPDYDGTATPADPTDDFGTTNTFGGPSGTYQVYVRDIAGCTSFDIGTIIQEDLPPPPPVFDVVNQCDVTSTAFDITVSVPNTVDTPRFTLGGDTQFGVLNGANYEYTYTVGTPGFYVVDVVDASGCTNQNTAEVFEFISASGGFTTESTCNVDDGIITIVPNGGSGQFDYELTGLDYQSNIVGPITQSDNAVFNGVAPGTYQVMVTDRVARAGGIFCTFPVNINLDAAVQPVILSATEQDISCDGADDGTIDIVLQPGTDVDSPIDYRLLNFDTRAFISNNASGSFPNLPPGRYDVEVVSSRNCSVFSGLLEITEPLPFSISASAPDFACEPGANRFSSTIITVVDPATTANPGTSGNYQYSITGFSNYQSANTFEIVDNGSIQNITVYAIDANGCEATTVVSINPPTDVVPSIVQIDPLNCRDDERVRIQVIGSTNFTVSTISATPVSPVTNTPGNNYVDVFLPASGDYLFEVQDNIGGCAYPMPKHTVNDPIFPIVLISEAKPVSCFGASDGELAIDVTDYTGVYTYNVYSGNDPGKTTILANGTLDTANNTEIISGLPGGNFFVEVVSTAMPFCSSDSNVATITTPNRTVKCNGC